MYLPIGFAANTWGNTLYGTPWRMEGLALFLGGLVLTFYGVRFWRGATQNWGPWQQLRARVVRRWSQTFTSRWNDPAWQERWRMLKISAWGIGTALVALYAWRLLNRVAAEPRGLENSDFLSALLLQVAWMMLPFWHQWADPANPSDTRLLDRMSARIWRAAISRTVGNAAGIYLAGFVIYMAVFDSRPSLAVPVAVTLGAAMIGAGHRTWARLRKLSTQLYKNIRELERDLQQIGLTDDDGKCKARDAARRTWDAVEIDLRTNVDTGYAFLGIPFLPSEATVALREKVEQAIEGDPVALKDAGGDLAKIREACEGRLDSAA